MFDGEQLNWSKVDDFDWLHEGSSPHWSILEESARVPRSIWEEVISDHAELDKTLELTTP